MLESALPPLDMTIAWHGRLMVLAWVILFPLGVLVARFFKKTPRQKWPEELDNRFWWHGHLVLQGLGGVAVLGAFALILAASPDPLRSSLIHRTLGWLVVILCVAQFASTLLRGTKGGPTDPGPDGSFSGDHYDRTPRRQRFERFHRTNGYLLLVLSMVTVITGLFTALAPPWMLVVIVLWWLLCLGLFALLQRRGLYMDSHRAIWGDSTAADDR